MFSPLSSSSPTPAPLALAASPIAPRASGQLLTWKDRGVTDIESILKNVVFVESIELIKFMDKILKALFDMLEAPVNATLQLDSHIFVALITILSLSDNKRFTYLRAMLDHFINTVRVSQCGERAQERGRERGQGGGREKGKDGLRNCDQMLPAAVCLF